MDNDKKNLDELFQFGNKILSRLQAAASEKSTALENSRRQFDDLRQNLKNLLDAADK